MHAPIRIPGYRIWIFRLADGWYVGHAPGSDPASGPHASEHAARFAASELVNTSGT